MNGFGSSGFHPIVNDVCRDISESLLGVSESGVKMCRERTVNTRSDHAGMSPTPGLVLEMEGNAKTFVNID